MDLSVIFQLRTKKFWWMDVIFYFVVSLLVATVFCYFVFLFKDGMIRQQISDNETQLQQVGTLQQKQHEAEVMTYQKKIADFTILLKNHEFASNVFAFMQAQTMPNIWFSQFSLDEKGGSIQLNGEADSLNDFSRQVASLENNKYVKNIGTLNSSLGESAKTQFSMGLVLDQSIFSYLPNIANASIPSAVQIAATPTAPVTSPANTNLTNKSPSSAGQQPSGATSQPGDNQKLITSFHIINPSIFGNVDLTNYIITINVPYGTDVKNLTPEIVVSPGAMVLPISLAPEDFTNPIAYKVTAKDGSTQDYMVKAVIEPSTVENKKANQPLSRTTIIIISAAVLIFIVAIIIIFLIRRKNKKIT